MARKMRPARKSKSVKLFIVEGCTEENYIKRLKILYDKSGEIENCHGGSAKAVLKQAKKLILEKGDNYTGYVVVFDYDRYESADEKLYAEICSQENTKIFISEPCFENWLLAHFERISKGKTCDKCEERLKRKYIPHYSKNDCYAMNKYVTCESIEKAKENYPEMADIVSEFQDE